MLRFRTLGVAAGLVPTLHAAWALEAHGKATLSDLRTAAAGNLALFARPAHPQPPLFSRASLNLVLLEIHNLLS